MDVKKSSDLEVKKPEQQQQQQRLLRKKALEAALDLEKPSSSPSRPPQSSSMDDGADEIQRKSEGEGGAQPKAGKPQAVEAAPVLSPTAAAAAKAAAAGLVTDLQKKLLRAERFGMAVQLSEEEKRSSRAERLVLEVKKSSDLEVKKPEQQQQQQRLLRKKALEAALDFEKPSFSPSRPPQSSSMDDGADEIQKKSEGEGGAQPKAVMPQAVEAAPVLSSTAAAAAKAAAAGLVTDLQKKLLRAERFGMAVQLSEEEKRSSRAERLTPGEFSGDSEDLVAEKLARSHSKQWE